MFNLFAKKELVITKVEGVNFVFNTKGTKHNFKKFDFLKECMKEVPAIVKERMVQKELIIRFTDEEEVVSVTESRSVLGFYCDAGVEVIFIKDNQSFTNLKNTLFHEIGHFVDRYIGKVCECEYVSLADESFHKIAIEEYNVHSFSYYKTNIKEYFAQSFSEFLLSSNKINSSPKTKGAMELYVSALY